MPSNRAGALTERSFTHFILIVGDYTILWGGKSNPPVSLTQLAGKTPPAAPGDQESGASSDSDLASAPFTLQFKGYNIAVNGR
ncbi:MAG TPA: hypothetical protein VNN62_02155 [Methylomirabilota bacterium]|nr:hypothetical protein [Methylomirabilota bacterium]